MSKRTKPSRVRLASRYCLSAAAAFDDAAAITSTYDTAWNAVSGRASAGGCACAAGAAATRKAMSDSKRTIDFVTATPHSKYRDGFSRRRDDHESLPQSHREHREKIGQAVSHGRSVSL